MTRLYAHNDIVMDSSRAVQVAVVIGVFGAGAWLFRDDHACRAEIKHQFGDVIAIQHQLASNEYKFVPPSWRDAWRPGMRYPASATCWTSLLGDAELTKH
jgi:hypothetical protein